MPSNAIFLVAGISLIIPFLGRTAIGWIVLQAMILFSALVWLNQSTLIATNNVISDVRHNFTESIPPALENYLYDLRQGIIQNMTIVVLLFTISLFMMLNNYRIMSRRANESEKQLGNIRESAYSDPLTGVKSKLALNEKITEINEKINEDKSDIFAVAVCDVNGLKVVNDTLGHKAGDEYLKKACMLVCKAFQHSPVYRLGGDEFVVFISGLDFDNRHEILNKLNKTIEENIEKKEAVISIGISDYIASSDECFNDVMERADINMYTRKTILKSMGASTRI